MTKNEKGVQRWKDAIKETRGSADSHKYFAEYESKSGKAWKFLCWSYPSGGVGYTLKAFRDNVYLISADGTERYRVKSGSYDFTGFFAD